MEPEKVWIGIDIGTTSIKISINDSSICEAKKCICTEVQETNACVKSDVGEMGFEQCPLTILKVLEQTVLPILSTYKTRIGGIGISGQMHGVVLWRKVCEKSATKSSVCGEEANNVKTSLHEIVSCHSPSHLYTWQDQRCSPSFLATLPHPSNSKLPISTGHGCATLFWLSKSENSTLDPGQYDCCGTIMDFLVFVLCGLNHPVTSGQLAASLGYVNEENSDWDSTLRDAPEFPYHLMPSVIRAGTKVGVIQPNISSWPSGVPLLVAMGDVQCAMAHVLKTPNQAAVNLSTSVQLGFSLPSKKIAQSQWPTPISFFPYFGEQHLALCTGLNGGNAVRRFVECVACWMKDLGFSEDMCSTSSVLSRLQHLAEEDRCSDRENKSQGSSQLTVRPTFYGERHDPSLMAEISNISLTNFHKIGHIFRSVCEGLVFHLADMIHPEFLSDRGIKELLVCGSVPEKNPLIKNALQSAYSKYGLVVKFEGADENSASSAIGAAKIARNILKD